MIQTDERYMRRALELAERGWGQVAPNPLVGAVVVAAGEVVGEGYHARFGEEHAEVVALREAGAKAAGSTLYVNLEPCAHVGKTPACERAIREAGVQEVVVACRDPNPEAAGGLESLEASGIRVRVGPAARAACRLNAPFFWRVTQEMPYVALKLAVSIDGKIAARRGVRTTITGEAASEEVHRLRAGFDALLVGSETAVVDDPRLTVRGAASPRVHPVRLVLDSRLRLSPSSRLVSSVDQAPVWVLGAGGAGRDQREQLEEKGVRVLEVASGAGGVDLATALRVLKRAGIGSVLVEGGARVASALLRHRLVHRFYLLVAPMVLGREGVPALAELVPSVEGEWQPVERRAFDRDTLIVFENRHALATLAEGGHT